MEKHIPEDGHWWFASRTRAIQALLDPHMPPDPATVQVLDVGCGAGNMIHHLSAYGQVKGLDIDARPVAVAQERGYDVSQFDVTQPMPIPEQSVTLVTALDVIEHNNDDMAILRDSFRVLKPGGYMLITVPAFMWLWTHNDDLNAHVRRYTASELRRKLSEVGFHVKRLSYNNFFIFPPAAGLLSLRRLIKGKPELASHHVDTDAYQVEMEPASPAVNAVLTVVGKVEAGLMRWLDLPVGTSLLALAQKPTD